MFLNLDRNDLNVMMIKKHTGYLLVIILFVTGLLLSANVCAQNKNSKKDKELSEQQIRKRTNFFMEGNKQRILDNIDKAEEYYKKALEIDPDHDASLYELARIYMWQDRADDAILLMNKAVAVNPENVWYKLFQAELYKRTMQFDKVVETYESLVEAHPENIDYQYDLALSYIINGDYKKALEAYDHLEELIGVNEELSLKKQKLYLSLNKPKKALDEIEKLVAKNPNNTRYLEILAESFINVGKDDKALETYRKIAQLDPDNPYIRISLSDFYRKKGEDQKAFEELKLGFANPNLELKTKLQILLSYYSINQFYDDNNEQAFELAKILAETHPENANALAIYGDLLYRKGKTEEAYEVFSRAIEHDQSNYGIYEQLLFIQNELSKTDELEKTSSETMELFPMQPLPYLFNGFANTRKKNYDKAVKSLEAGSKLVVDNDKLLAQFYSSLGDVYHELKNDEESDAYYEKALAIIPNDPFVLNNYAYYLSLRNENLEKAGKMARKANDLDPENPSFQDTYGWVLYKLGMYEQAEKWIKKALDNEEKDSAVLLEHYGDVLFRLGRTDEALQYWQKAKDTGEKASDFLDQKIRDHQLYE